MNQFNIYDSLIDFSAIKDFCRENGRLCHYPKEAVFVEQEIGRASCRERV